MEKVYAYIRTLSLDVVAGALFSTLALSRLLNVDPGVPVLLALCFAVWVVYTFDHLIDARKIDHEAHTPRHRFHQRYFSVLAIAITLFALSGVVLLFKIPRSTLIAGLAVSAVTLVYFLTLRLFKLRTAFQKELFIALVYVLGIFTAPVSLSHQASFPYLYLLFGQYLLLAFANLVLFAWYEQDTDRADGHSSLVLKIGSRKSFRLVSALFGLTGLSIAYGLLTSTPISTAWWYQVVLFCMLATLVFLGLFPAYFRVNERYRAFGDGAFMIPGLILLL
ncbi:MAG: hypothetical protein WBB45_14005 [Cyclobacteriaceae bacterium]